MEYDAISYWYHDMYPDYILEYIPKDGSIQTKTGLSCI